MLPTDTRCFLRHEKALFEPGALNQVRDHFLREEAAKQSAIQNETDKIRVRIGASTAALRMDPRWYDPWRNASPQLIERLRPYTWLLFPVHIRHLKADSHLVPWHQDGGYVKLMPRQHKRLITCFVPLEPVPTDCSTLEFAEGDFDDEAHVPEGDHGAAMPDPKHAPHRRFDLAFGDAMLFGDRVPHRTVPAASGAIERRSFEYRMVIPDEALDDKDYFDLELGCFVRTDGSRREFPE